MIVNALAGKPLSAYGDGLQVRDWRYGKAHWRAGRWMKVLLFGRRSRLESAPMIGPYNELGER